MFLKFLITCIGLSYSIASKADDEPIIGEWKSATVPYFGGRINMKFKFEFLADQKCKVQIDNTANLAGFDQSAASFLHECSYQLRDTQSVDVEFTQVYKTLLDPVSVQKHNKEKQCGFDDWKLGEAKNISNLVCKDASGFKVGEKLLDIYEFSADKKFLYFGIDYANLAQLKPGLPRPTSISKRVVFAIKGEIPPDVGEDPVVTDLLTGIYKVDRVSLSETSCDSEGAPEANAPQYISLYQPNVVIPVFVGAWMGKDCATRSECEVQDGFFKQHPWNVHTVVTPNKKWDGHSDMFFRIGPASCRTKRVASIITRNDDGSLHLISRHYEATTSFDPQNLDSCSANDLAIKEALSKAPCLKQRTAYTFPKE